jgi:(p)ppGpp synthase/HD superfamily hydrolase
LGTPHKQRGACRSIAGRYNALFVFQNCTDIRSGEIDGIQRALRKAFECHKGQTRKAGGAPYIVHVLDVARILLSEPGVSEEVVVAGILHDTLEDTPYMARQLEHDFGPAILSLVRFTSEPGEDHTTTWQEIIRAWRARKEHTIRACDHASREQLLVLIADKLSNLTSLQEEMHLHGEAIWTSFRAATIIAGALILEEPCTIGRWQNLL